MIWLWKIYIQGADTKRAAPAPTARHGAGPEVTVPFVCWRDPIRYRDRVGRREPAVPRVLEAVQKRGPRRPCHRNPNGHQGRQARIQRDRVMDKAPTFVGIDVAKRRLDLHSRPSGASSTSGYDDENAAAPVQRPVPPRPH